VIVTHNVLLDIAHQLVLVKTLVLLLKALDLIMMDASVLQLLIVYQEVAMVVCVNQIVVPILIWQPLALVPIILSANQDIALKETLANHLVLKLMELVLTMLAVIVKTQLTVYQDIAMEIPADQTALLEH
jgi:hypothetical protein